MRRPPLHPTSPDDCLAAMKLTANQDPKKPPSLEAVWAQRPAFVQAGWLSLISGVILLAPSWFMFEVYGRVLNSRNVKTLGMLLLCVIGIYLVIALLDYVRARVLNQAANQIDEDLRKPVFGAVFEANLRRAPGGTTQVFGDLRTLREFIPSQFVTASMDAPSALVFLALLYALSPWLGTLALLGAFIQVTLAWITERKTMPLLTEASVASSSAMTYASSSLRNAPVIEAMGMVDAVHDRWQSRQRRFLGLQSAASDHAGVTTSLAKLVQTMQGSLLLGAACLLILQNDLWGGSSMMIISSILGARVLAPLSQIVTQWRSLVTVRDAYRRLAQILRQFPEKSTGMSLPAPQGVLTVEGVIAGAAGSNVPILRNVNFALRPGEVVAVIGPAAAGKTTLARLLVGMWPASTGKVRLDGADVHSWNKEELGPHVGYLPQSVELFDGTVAENIARFGKVDIDRVRAAAEQAGVLEAIEAMPQGFDTAIGDDGAVLSGGQRQRIGLARAVYGDPRLLVLDEPNSSLDEAGEEALLKLLQAAAARGATVVVITHRTNILAAVSKLLVLRDGQVAAFGPRDEVVAALKKAAEQAAGAKDALKKPGQVPAQMKRGTP
jgi:ATP-binding cassette subfamily C exporter for protease/lipase